MFVERFQAFRTGWGFIVALGAFIGLWLCIHVALPAFDDHLELLNLVLSIEASFAMPVLLMAQEKAAKAERRDAIEVLHSVRHLTRTLDKLLSTTVEIHEDVEDIEEHLGGVPAAAIA